MILTLLTKMVAFHERHTLKVSGVLGLKNTFKANSKPGLTLEILL